MSKPSSLQTADTGRNLVPDRPSDLPIGRECVFVGDGIYTRIAGVVIARQPPGTASGFVFLSLEDETGISNAIINSIYTSGTEWR